MGTEPLERKLAAILYADVAGYSRLTGEDEDGTHHTLRAYLDAITSHIQVHRGRVVHYAGDAVLAEFGAVSNALSCAVDVQRDLNARNQDLPDDRKVQFRIGVNLGEVIVDQDEIYGDGVNIAARLQTLAEPGGICISESVLNAVGNRLPLTYESIGSQLVKNIARPVSAYRVISSSPKVPNVSALVNRADQLSDKPSIVVLPFNNLSGDASQDYFIDGVVEEITTNLARLSWLFVIARNSAFTYKNRSVDTREIAKELGVRYVLEGSVRQAGNRVRITGQLIDAAANKHIWAERFEGQLDDIFGLQDRVAANVAGAIEPSLRSAELEHSKKKPPENLAAYDYFLRALPHYRQHTPEGFEAALTLLEEALKLQPDYAPANVLAAQCIGRPLGAGWEPWSEEKASKAVALARTAIKADSNDPFVLAHAGAVFVVGGREFETGLTLFRRAIKLNPNSAEVFERAGWAEIWSGYLEEAIDHLERARRLSPVDPGMHDILTGISAANFFLGRDEKAVEFAREALVVKPDFTVAHRYLAASLAHLGQVDEARSVVKRLLTIQPNDTLAHVRKRSAMMARVAEQPTRFLQGLHLAGLPE